MNLMCGALKNLWYEFYNTYIKNVDIKTKIMIGGICLFLALVFFVMCTKGPKKSEMVNSWFLFWISMVLFLVGVYYLVFA